MWRQPEIQLLLSPNPPVAGQELMLETVLWLEQPARIDEVEVRLRGQESFALAAGHAPQVVRPFVEQQTRFAPMQLGPGQHRLRSSFVLPAGEMGAYAGRSVRVDYEAAVRVRVSWWFDAQEDFALPELLRTQTQRNNIFWRKRILSTSR